MQMSDKSRPLLSAAGFKFGIVASRFNFLITQRLVEGAIEGLVDHGVASKDIKVTWVPGAFELPLVAKKMAESQTCEAVICVGAVIRGETAHFDYVASQAASGILQASLTTDVPVIFSVLTTENLEQAEARAGSKENNNGYSGALSAIEMIHLLKTL